MSALTGQDMALILSGISIIVGLAGAGVWKWLSHLQDVVMVIQADIKHILERLPPACKPED